MPHAQKTEVKEQIQKMVKDQSKILVPKESSGDKKKWRLVIDYRKLNRVIEDDKFPLPNI